jgi:hypothetical protein
MVLGSTATLTPDQARMAARKVLAAVALGEDPAALRSRAREMPTFRQFADRYLDEEAVAKLKPSTVVNYRIYLRKHAVPLIGNLKLDRITAADIAKMHRRIGQTKPMTANRVVECISSVYRYATTCGLVDRGFNPPLTSRLSASNVGRDFLPTRSWPGSVRRSVRLKPPAFLGMSMRQSPQQSMSPKRIVAR